MQLIRNAVKENALSNPALVTEKDYRIFLLERGKGWVWEKDGVVTGFAIADLKGHNIRALFIKPDFKRRGIGRQLHNTMLNDISGRPGYLYGSAPRRRPGRKSFIVQRAG